MTDVECTDRAITKIVAIIFEFSRARLRRPQNMLDMVQRSKLQNSSITLKAVEKYFTIRW